jgi:hypothetical protein
MHSLFSAHSVSPREILFSSVCIGIHRWLKILPVTLIDRSEYCRLSPPGC